MEVWFTETIVEIVNRDKIAWRKKEAKSLSLGESVYVHTRTHTHTP